MLKLEHGTRWESVWYFPVRNGTLFFERTATFPCKRTSVLIPADVGDRPRGGATEPKAPVSGPAMDSRYGGATGAAPDSSAGRGGSPVLSRFLPMPMTDPENGEDWLAPGLFL